MTAPPDAPAARDAPDGPPTASAPRVRFPGRNSALGTVPEPKAGPRLRQPGLVLGGQPAPPPGQDDGRNLPEQPGQEGERLLAVAVLSQRYAGQGGQLPGHPGAVVHLDGQGVPAVRVDDTAA